MKKFFAFAALAAVLITAFIGFAACNDKPSAAALSMLSAVGEDIVDADGNAVVLRGTNFGGWLVQEGWMCPTEQTDTLSTDMTLYSRFGKERAEELISAYQDSWITEEDFKTVKELGLNVVRVPFTYMNVYHHLSDEGELLHPDEFTLREDPFERLDFALEMCRKYGLYLILDMHGAVGSQNGSDHSGDTSRTNLYADTALGEAYREKTAELWALVAEHFAGESNVAGYDLLNEPTRASGATQWDYYDVLYKAVREADPDHMIFIEATWEPNNLPSPEDYGWENVVYEYHHYNWDYNDQSNKSFYTFKKLLGNTHKVPSLRSDRPRSQRRRAGILQRRRLALDDLDIQGGGHPARQQLGALQRLYSSQRRDEDRPGDGLLRGHPCGMVERGHGGALHPLLRLCRHRLGGGSRSLRARRSRGRLQHTRHLI